MTSSVTGVLVGQSEVRGESGRSPRLVIAIMSFGCVRFASSVFTGRRRRQVCPLMTCLRWSTPTDEVISCGFRLPFRNIIVSLLTHQLWLQMIGFLLLNGTGAKLCGVSSTLIRHIMTGSTFVFGRKKALPGKILARSLGGVYNVLAYHSRMFVEDDIGAREKPGLVLGRLNDIIVRLRQPPGAEISNPKDILVSGTSQPVQDGGH